MSGICWAVGGLSLGIALWLARLLLERAERWLDKRWP